MTATVRTHRRALVVLVVLAVFWDIDIGGRCACDDPLPKVSSVEVIK